MLHPKHFQKTSTPECLALQKLHPKVVGPSNLQEKFPSGQTQPYLAPLSIFMLHNFADFV